MTRLGRSPLLLSGVFGLVLSLGACGARTTLTLSDGSGGATSTASTGASASTSGSGGGCTPGDVVPCAYSGPPGTEGVGVCRAGQATCAPDGATFGPCAGEVLPTAESCGDGADRDCDGDPADCAIEALWAAPAVTGGSALVRDLAELPNGDLVVYGTFSGFLAWGGLTIAVGTDPQGFLALFSPDGDVKELRALVAKNGYLKPGAMAVDGAGNVYVSGGLAGSMDYANITFFAPAQEDAFVLAVAGDLAPRWARVFSGPSADIGWAVAAAGDAVYVGGQFETNIDLGHGPVGGPAGDTDMFLVRLDTEGANVWEKTYGEPQPQTLEVLAVLSGGELALAATAAGSVDFGLGPLTVPDGAAHGVTALLTENAGILANDVFAGQGSSYPRQLAAGAGGRLAIGGRTFGPTSWGGAPICVGSDGGVGTSFVVLTTGGAPGAVHCGADVLDVALRPDGDALLLGGFNDTLTLGQKTLSADGPQDFFLATFTPEGAYPVFGRAGDGSWNALDGRVVASAPGEAVVALSYFGDFDLFGAPLPSGSSEATGLVVARLRVP